MIRAARVLCNLLFFLPAVSLLAGACSLDYQELAEDLDENTPAVEMMGVRLVSVENGREHSRVEAERIADFDKLYKRTIEGGKFTEYDEPGDISAEGEAVLITIDTRTDNAVLEGHIRFNSVRDKATVSAEYLEWNDSDRLLSGNPAGEVLLEKEDGTTIRGTGFSADFPSRIFRFAGRASGIWKGSDKSDTEAGLP